MRFISAAILTIAFGTASATTIDFEDQIDGGYLSSVESGGFDFVTDLGGDSLLVATGGVIGGDYSLAWCVSCNLIMSESNGAVFSLGSFDTYSLATSLGTFVLTGYRTDGSSVSTTFTGTGSPQTISLDNDWTGLTSVVFDPQYYSDLGHVIDNIEVSVVPVPATAWLFGSALAGLGWIKRKHAV